METEPEGLGEGVRWWLYERQSHLNKHKRSQNINTRIWHTWKEYGPKKMYRFNKILNKYNENIVIK